MITFFLGAGASNPFGYPTTKDFMEISDKSLKGNSLYREIMSFLETSKQIIDIEIVLWEIDKLLDSFAVMEERDTFKKWFYFDSGRAYYSFQNANHSFAAFMNQARGTAKVLKSDIDKLVYDTYWRECDLRAKEYYGHLLTIFRNAFLPNDRVNIFTTNYDLIIENCAFLGDPTFSDGFRTITRHSYWDTSHYEQSAIRLYKLHGSIDWKRQPDGKVYSVPTHDFTKHEDHVILYPGFKGEPTEEPFKSMHEAFKDSLGFPGICVFVGFSFRDEYINKLISRSLAENHELHLVIWNPEKPDGALLLPHQERISYFLQRFGESLTLIQELLNLLESSNLLV